MPLHDDVTGNYFKIFKQKNIIMKKQSTVLFNQLSQPALAALTTEVKETIAFDLVVPAPKKFTAADLWNIHRQVKVRSQRRFL